jgi:hypothetical protein
VCQNLGSIVAAGVSDAVHTCVLRMALALTAYPC